MKAFSEGKDPEGIGGWNVDTAGALFGWNVLPGSIGLAAGKIAKRPTSLSSATGLGTV